MINPYDKINKDKECISNCRYIITSNKADTISIGKVTTTDSYEEAKVIDNKEGNNHNLEFILPRGERGSEGPELLKVAYLVTFNDGTYPDGIKVLPGGNIPITRKELDTNGIISFDSTNNMIKFNLVGYYKITFNVSAYPEVNTVDFDSTKDIVSIGFKENGTDNIYVGVSSFVYDGEAVFCGTSGVISVTDTDKDYVLSNTGKYSIYLDTPKLSNVDSKSYFVNSLVTIIIDYLGNK